MHKNCVMLIALILGPLLSITGSPQTNAEAIDWDKILNAAHIYFASPTSENAFEFYTVLPKTQVRGEARETEFSKVFYYIDGNLDVLERQVLKADRNAVKVAVRLFTISDGAFSEWLDSMLGDLIRVDPKMFLEEIREFPWRNNYKDFKEWLLRRGNQLCNGRILDVESKASDKTKRKELELRIIALDTVKDANLADLRDECIAIIRKYIARVFESPRARSRFSPYNRLQIRRIRG